MPSTRTEFTCNTIPPCSGSSPQAEPTAGIGGSPASSPDVDYRMPPAALDEVDESVGGSSAGRGSRSDPMTSPASSTAHAYAPKGVGG